jgi:amidase
MSFIIEEATITTMQEAMESGELTSKQLVLLYLERIANYDKEGPKVNAVLELNPDVLFIAEALDVERAANGSRGTMHGIPIMLKDNVNTGDKMHTSAGSLALANSYAPADAFIVRKLREAGAIILGKTNMTEFANFMTQGMPNGYSSRGGQVLNPYDAATRTGGSSSGSAVAVAANFCAAAVGTETSGSILNPGNFNSIVGIKPTVGLISRSGIIPLANSQDTAGPMARTVTDAVYLLNALTGEDASDPATWSSAGRGHADYSLFLDKNGLNGARIGIPRDCYYEELTEEQLALMHHSIEIMKQQGAIIVDSANIPTAKQIAGSSVLLHEFKPSMNAYLANLGPNTPMRSLREIIDYNNQHPLETLKYGQNSLINAEYKTSGTLTEPQYIRDRANDLRLSQSEGIDASMNKYNLDALLFPSDWGSDIAAKAGYPSIIVPAGYIDGVPFGMTFTAQAYSEPQLIKLAYAYEQQTKVRMAPQF